MTNTATVEQQKQAVNEVISKYLNSVKTWNESGFRETFHPKANIQHYYVKGDDIKTITLDEFVSSIASLHSKYENAEEKAREIEIQIVDHLASVRVAFSFVMGPRTMDGQDLFNLAFCKGKWVIIHKSYYL
jgi:hypothetical protein